MSLKPRYYILIAIILLIGVSGQYLDLIHDDKINLNTALIALIISIISLGIADKKQRKLKLKFSVWKRKEKQREGSDKINSIAFQLDNLNKVPLEDLVVSFRFEASIYDRSIDNNQNNSYFEFGERIVVQNDTIKFLGVDHADRFVRFQHYVRDFHKWEKGKIAVTVSCRNFIPTTHQIDFSERDELLEATYENPKNYYINVREPKFSG